MVLAAWLSSPRTRYRRPRSSAKPIRPNKTGTMITSNCKVIAPRSSVGLGPAPCLLFGYLLATGSYKLRLIAGRSRRGFVLTLLLGFFFLHSREESFGHIRQLGLLFGTERTNEMRSDHHQQLVVGF